MDHDHDRTSETGNETEAAAAQDDASLELTPEAEPENPAEQAPEPEESMESLLAQQSKFSEMLTGRKPVWVKVIQVTKDAVLVDIGEKREGTVPLSEFGPQAKEGEAAEGRKPAVGQRIPVILMTGIRSDRATLLSYRKARESLAWDAAVRAHAEKSRVRGTVTAHVKGGFLVDVGGVRAFLPASLADLRPVRSPERMLKTGVRCYIIELNQSKKQVVLSRKAVLEEDAAKRRAKTLAELRVGEVRIGRVVHAGAEGLLVDIGGLEGFVKTEDICWGKPKASSELARGGKLKVKVLGKPAEGSPDKVSLGIKQLTPNPADGLRRKFAPKAVVRGKVVESSPAGVTLRLEDGTAAFCFPADCVEGQAYKEGDQVSGVVSGVDGTNLRVTVSLRKLDDMKERKRMASYLKPPPPLTLGELLAPASSPAPSEERGGKDDPPAAGGGSRKQAVA
ncbi:MAG: S1 RNA-binding domain-containing protein [Elusimicrobia bacterium]|nr:S1 RNA-binding domain-containing protein [Elusimicrobiota bacterium]